LRTSDFDYRLPPELVATHPQSPRDASRLMRLDRFSGRRNHAHFRDLAGLLPQGSLLVLNDTRVLPARIHGTKATGGAVELLLTRMVRREAIPDRTVEIWETLGKNLGRTRGERIAFGPGLAAEILERYEDGKALVRLEVSGGGDVMSKLEQQGQVPLPPYIEAARKRAAAEQAASMSPAAPAAAAVPTDDRERYQTVYAAAPGAVAAPTAGLHFTPDLLGQLEAAGHQIVRLTLHVGPGTFRPVKTDEPREHAMDAERFEIPPATASAVNAARASGRPIVAVGTTVVRTLEAAARAGQGDGEVRPGAGETDLYLLPGAEFRVVTDLITNFHLPRSTLLMLVAAFAGREAILDAYREAVEAGYRFYSYGDAMLITGRERAAG
jgi:S-adenosylmethionine:tRNA ribosyltransferase-isomerase